MKRQALLPWLVLAVVGLATAVSGWTAGQVLAQADSAATPASPTAVAKSLPVPGPTGSDSRAGPDGFPAGTDASPADAEAALARDIAALAPQRPGHPDLYVLGFAGDGSEQVFRNEVLHLENLATQRLDAAGRVLVLANHDDAPITRPLPAATLPNLRLALAAVGERMDRDEDLLLLYLTTHGTADHELLLRGPGRDDDFLAPRELRRALDDAGIRHRVLVISACYSGGFARALSDPDTLVLMAAHRDRASFGCGTDSAATYFGRAWLVDGLNANVDFVAAFRQASVQIERREMADGLPPSRPQINQGQRIGARLAIWREAFAPGPELAYPYRDPEYEPGFGDYTGAGGEASPELTPPLLRADNQSLR